MEIYTIGTTKRSAKDFFGALEAAGVQRMVDVRLNNRSQLAGFTKSSDLPFFLDRLINVSYVHEPLLAPTQDMLTAFRGKDIDWTDYEARYIALITSRRIDELLDPLDFNESTVLLCSELTPERCHRRLAAEYLATRWTDVEITHL